MSRPRESVTAPAQAQVFVSYVSADVERVLPFVRRLESHGISVWRDGDRIMGGQYYGEEIVHAIAHSQILLLMCSPHAFRSDNFHREVLLTWDYYHRRYLPVWLSPPTDLPDRFRYCLVGCQRIETHDRPPDQWLPELVKALASLGVGPAGSDASTANPSSAGGASAKPRGPRFHPGDRPIVGADWELVQLIGKDGYGEVWKAHHPELPFQPPVALKFCLELDERGKQLLRHEADMVLRMQQNAGTAGIVPLIHAYLNNDPPSLEYPYVPGGTLVRLIDEARQTGKPLTPAQVQRVVQRLAQIVGTAHRATPPLVHRDLKPSNVLVNRQPDQKLSFRVADFGIGAIVAQPLLVKSRSSASLRENFTSVLTGAYTPLYASPQQMRGDSADPRDDVYALGVIWYQLLTGDLTSPAPTGRMWIKALSQRGMSEPAIDLMAACVENEPAHRPADAAELAQRLQALPATISSTSDVMEVLPAESFKDLPSPTAAAPKAGHEPPSLSLPVPISVAGAATPAPPRRYGHCVLAGGAVVALGLVAWLLAGIMFKLRVQTADGTADVFINSIKMKMVLIPAGTFPMGSSKAEKDHQDNEGDQPHEVEITKPFYMGAYEVTRGQFRAFVEDRDYRTDAEKDGLGGWGYDDTTKQFKGPTYNAQTQELEGPGTNYSWRDAGFEQTDEHPVVNVSWNDAVAFCRWLSGKEHKQYRLPTEAEWEYSCRAGTTTRFSSGDDEESLVKVGNVADASLQQQHPSWTTIVGDDAYVFTAPVGQFQPNVFGLYDMHGNVWGVVFGLVR